VILKLATRALRSAPPFTCLSGRLSSWLMSTSWVRRPAVVDSLGHGTSSSPVQRDLRWGAAHKLADAICNFNRHDAEEAGYFQTTAFLKEGLAKGESEVTFYDSNTGKSLFSAPRGRTWKEFVDESSSHGWPSFRDTEVNWSFVRVLPDGETVSIHGTHLGHNLPDKSGNRYCINLVSVAGRPQRGFQS